MCVRPYGQAGIVELAFLRPLDERQGPYVSVYADMTRTAEEVQKAPDPRWCANATGRWFLVLFGIDLHLA